MAITVQQVRPWVIMGTGVALIAAGIVMGNPSYVALGAGAVGVQGVAHANGK